MEENPSRVQPRDGSHKRGPTKNHRCPVDDGGGDPIDCSGKNCQSCTAGMIADCVAVCCCPCAVVSFFALAFLKAPWMMGRRCLGIGKKKSRSLEKKRKCESDCGEDIDGNSRKGRVGVETSEIVTGLEDEGQEEEEEEEEDNLSARFEAEKVWLELYQLGHLGFGRVSFTGIQSQSKGN